MFPLSLSLGPTPFSSSPPLPESPSCLPPASPAHSAAHDCFFAVVWVPCELPMFLPPRHLLVLPQSGPAT